MGQNITMKDMMEKVIPADESRRFVNPQKVYVDLSQKLWDLKKDLLEEISEKALD